MESSSFDPTRLKSAKKIKKDNNFIPCPVDNGDELFSNGIFVFNITKMLDYIAKNLEQFKCVKINVDDFPKGNSSINESHLDSIDVFKPVILAEISPGRYNLIDGNHRMEKARRMGIKSIFAYKLNVEQHLQFLIKKSAYLSFVEYWNGKINLIT